LGYDWEGVAPPIVLAAGVDAVAQCILQCARDNGVAVHGDPTLAELLAGLELRSPVPEELWAAVAAILAFLWRTDARLRARTRR
jgi:flagellar biosynthesis protein